jgi:hypothetical protein
MRHNTITEHHESSYPIAEALWVLAGIILLLALGDILILLALTVAIVAMATVWWAHRTVEHRAQGNGAEVASVTHLRPASTGHRDLKRFTAHAPWRGHSVA